MNQKLCLMTFGLFALILSMHVNSVFAEQSTLKFYGIGTVDETSVSPQVMVRTLLDSNRATFVHVGNGIEIVRMDLHSSDVCNQTKAVFCYDAIVTESNIDTHNVGDKITITLDLANNKEIIHFESGKIQGTTFTITLAKTIIKSDAPFTISISKEGGFAGFPSKTISFHSFNGSLIESNMESSTPFYLPHDIIDDLINQVQKSNLLNIIQENYPPQPQSADYFTYTLEFDQDVFSKTIRWTDTSDAVPEKINSIRDKLQFLASSKYESPNSEIAKIARDFVLSSPTFDFDGMENTLEFGPIMEMESFPVQYQIKVSFTSSHGGFGNRTGQMITQAITPHKMIIIVSEGNVISAVTDEIWDELNNQYVLKPKLPSSDEPVTPFEGMATDYTSLIDAIKSRGVLVEKVEEISAESSSFSVPTFVISVGGSNVQVFEFANETDAKTSSLTVSPDGTEIGTSVIRWMDEPHFYTNGKLIVLYVGQNPEIVNLLESFLGKQFAGM